MGKITVVGAGPAGCLAAAESAAEYDVRLFEDHKVQPVQCTGLVSKSGFERLGIGLGDYVVNSVVGAKMYSSSGSQLEIRAKSEKAYVLDRRLFDAHLRDIAVDKGVDFSNQKVTNLTGNTIVAAGERVKSDRIVVATGTNYHLQKAAGFETPREFLIGAQYDLKVECEPDMVELHFIVDDFFAWVVPAGDIARVGLCTKANPIPILDSFVRKLQQNNRVKSTKPLERSFGTIPIYQPNMKTQYGNNILVGDAAGHVKATTGGGIVLGGLAAKLSVYPDYERRWREQIGRELQMHLLMRRFLNRLSPAGMDRFIRLFEGRQHILESQGDMDMLSDNLIALFKNPSFTFKFLLNMPSFFIDILL